MRVLGLDTSTKYAGVAVVEEGKLLAHASLQFMASHSEKLIPEIAHTLEIMKIPLESIEIYAVTIGPGSFTGLRVAISTVKGLSFVTGKKIAPLSTLEVMARGLPLTDFCICPMLDARKNEVYAALFKWKDGILIRLRDDSVLKPERLVEWISEKTVFIGDGASLYRDKLINTFSDKAFFTHSIYNVPSPAIVALMGEEKSKRGELVSARTLAPLYLRKSEAEIKFG